MEAKSHINRNQKANSAAGFATKLPRYKQLLFAYWWIILLITAVCLTGQWLLIRHLPPSYVSIGQMIVNIKLSIPTENTYVEELEYFYGTQVALMQSDSVVSRVNQRLKAANPDWQWQQVRIQVGMVPKTSIFSLQAVGRDPVYTQAYLEATMEEYVNLKKDLLVSASTAAQSGLQEELAQMEVKLQRSKEDYLNFQSSNSMVLMQEEGGNSASAYLATLTKQLEASESDLQLLEALPDDESLGNQLNEGTAVVPASTPSSTAPAALQAGSMATTTTEAAPGSATPGTSPAASPGGSLTETASSTPVSPTAAGLEAAYLQAKQQLILLKSRRDQMIKLTPAAFELTGLNDEIANQQKLLEIIQEQRQEELKNRKHALEAQIAYLKGQIEVWQVKALDANKILTAFGSLKERHQQLQGMYDQLLASLQTLDVDKGVGKDSVTILEPATPCLIQPSKKVQQMVLAGLIGVLLGGGILVLLDMKNDRPSSHLELESHFDLPLLGQFPLMKVTNKKTGVPLLQPEDDRHGLVEAYQNMRSALVYKDTPANHPRRIVIASASAQDGKSTVSANFAITLAQSGSRVLLVDADLRRGRLNEHFGVAAEPGLAEVLEQKCDWRSAIVPTAIPNLYLLPSGLRPARPGRLFAMHTSRFLAEIAGHYDYYLFDTTPVMAADDVSSLAPQVDGLIMVIRAGFTSSRIAKAALDLLRMRRVKVIGLAFNAVQPGGGGYNYYQDKNYYARPAAR